MVGLSGQTGARVSSCGRPCGGPAAETSSWEEPTHPGLRPPRQLRAWGRGGGVCMTLSLCWRVHESDSLIALFKKKNEQTPTSPGNSHQQRSYFSAVATKIRLCVWGSGFYWSQSTLCAGNICEKVLEKRSGGNSLPTG